MVDGAAQRALADVPLFKTLDGSEELSEVLAVMQPFEAAPGSELFRQGELADGLYVLSRGRAIVRARVPGDTLRTIDTLGPGAVLGEVSLIDREPRSASVEASTHVEGWFLSERRFRMLRSAHRPAARKLMAHICLVVCQRIRSRTAEVVAAAPPPGTPWESLGRRSAAAAPPLPASLTASSLSKLPVLARLAPAERESLLTAGRLREAPRGQVLWAEGEPATSCFVALRGALSIAVDRGPDAAERLFVLGPGQLAGVEAVFDVLPHAARCEVLEPAWLLELSAETLRSSALAGPTSLDLFDNLAVELVERLRGVTRTVSRLGAQGRLQPGL